jgi:hypothetical protein
MPPHQLPADWRSAFRFGPLELQRIMSAAMLIAAAKKLPKGDIKGRLLKAADELLGPLRHWSRLESTRQV